jgi:malate dehydrogenase (quinone)
VNTQKFDVVLVGGGIMSATLGTFLKVLNPNLSIQVFERLDEVSQESSNPWNNAGTGHAALCELNYMPDSKDGSLPDPAKAIAINEQFQLSREFWSWAVQQGVLQDPTTFISATPHMTFVRGAKDVDYLSRRFQALKDQPLFAGMEFSTDPDQIMKWAPLLIEGRESTEPIAATRITSGTDVDFGAITKQLFAHLQGLGVNVATSSEVTSVRKQTDGSWNLGIRGAKSVNAKFVFVGAGGWALKLLQKSGIAEAKGYGTFPVGGQWLRTDNPELVAKHKAKVYSQASVGAPPMSVPHLDTRVVNGKASLLFGPYATSNPKFLKNGSILDLPMSLRAANLVPYIAVALGNFGLIRYLVGELLKGKSRKFESLLEFMPTAKQADWELLNAGQRAQIIKKDAKKGGVLQFGTEIITSADGSISGLLGASPGASTAVYAMLEVLKKSFASEFSEWEPRLRELMPSFGTKPNTNAAAAAATLAATSKALKLN